MFGYQHQFIKSLVGGRPFGDVSAAEYLIGNGITNDATNFTSMISALSDYTRVIFKAGATYLIESQIAITKPLTFDLNGATIKGDGIDSLFNIQSDNVRIINGILDLNLSCNNGITGNGYDDLFFEKLTIKNIKLDAKNTNGGIYLTSCDRVHVDKCYFKDLHNSDCTDTSTRSPAVKFITCNDVFLSKLNMDTCGCGVNIYGSTNVYCTDINMATINNNAYYIQDASLNVNIQGGKINVAENGVVFYINSNYATDTSPTAVRVKGVEFNGIKNKGVQLRIGSGLVVADNTFIECNCAVGQGNGYSGSSHIHIHDNIIYKTTSSRPFLFEDDHDMDIHDNLFVGFEAEETYAMRFDNCNNNYVHHNPIIGDDTNLKYGISYATSNNNKFEENDITGTTSSDYNEVSGTGNIIKHEGEIKGENQIISGPSNASMDSAPSLTVKSTNGSVTQNDYIGKLAVYSSDTSGSGPGDKFIIAIKATGFNGNTHDAEFYIDGAMFLKALTNGAASIVLPTSDTNVPVGGIWNNGGSVAIKSS